MKKKIAGVLTTVLAASLFVSGNAPVTVQQDNMTAQSQDNEDQMRQMRKIHSRMRQTQRIHRLKWRKKRLR